MMEKERPMSKRTTILFVDDERDILDTIRVMLKSHLNAEKWQVEYFTDPSEAVRRTMAGDVDIVVSDMRMPRKTGLQVLEDIKRDEASRNTAVIILTGLSDRELKRKALEEGAADLLNKPILLEDLLARLCNTLKMKRYEDDLRDRNVKLDEMVRERTQQLEWSRLATIVHLAKAGEYKDEETGNHIIRVGSCCRSIAEHLGMDRAAVDMLAITAPLHDIGKIGIPDSILLKQGRLNEEEWVVMRSHTRIGYGILTTRLGKMTHLAPDLEWSGEDSTADDPMMRTAAVIALNHHERWDGKGYPNGISGEKIPLISSIVSISDMYDALRSERPYKSPFSHERSMEIIRNEDGHFIPDVRKAFLEVEGEMESLYALLGPSSEKKEPIDKIP